MGPQTQSHPPPIEQLVGRQRLRPGSGYLSIRVTTDGPTRVLQILDIKERVSSALSCCVVLQNVTIVDEMKFDSKKFIFILQKKTYALLEERDWSNISITQRPTQIDVDLHNPLNTRELHLSVDLPAGLGLSIVSRKPAEELVFSRLAGITMDYVDTPFNKSIDLSIGDVQIDNQLIEAQCTSVLYTTRNLASESNPRPAVHVAAEKLPSKKQNAEIFKHLIVSIKPTCIHLEERLILKFIDFVGVGGSDQEAPVDENDFNAQRFIQDVSAAHSKRYYFAAIKLVPSEIKLSFITSPKLSLHLQAIKRKLGLTFIKFEDATIEVEPYIRKHLFESSQFLIHSILKFFKDVSN